MLKEQVMLHDLQIKKIKEEFKANPKVLLVISNMQHIIDELIKENQELESIISEESVNMIGRF